MIPLGVRASRKETEWRVGGAPADGIADLAEQFPAQVIDPEVHKLLEEGPGRRRRFLDWGVFHVEHAFLDNWRRYHQALRQRNAALKQDGGDQDLAAWEQELAASGETLAQQRESYLSRLSTPLSTIGTALLDRPITLVAQPRLGRGSAVDSVRWKPAERGIAAIARPRPARIAATSSSRWMAGQRKTTSRAASRNWWPRR